MPSPPFIIAHRGATGYLPEHTLAAWQRAVDDGADAIETDVVLTADGHLICRHDCELSASTNISALPAFASRKTSRVIDIVKETGWFVEDFTLAELRPLRARQRFDFRGLELDGRFPVPTLADLLEFATGRRTPEGKPLQVIVEIKHASHFQAAGIGMADAIVKALADFSLTGADSSAVVESFEMKILHQLKNRVQTPLIQLVHSADRQPADVARSGGQLTYGQMITPAGLARIATYASAIGAWKGLIVPAADRAAEHAEHPKPGLPTSLIADAHAAGLAVHAWTFRDEPVFLAAQYGNDPRREYQQFAALGLDGFVTDFPDTARQALFNRKRS